MSKFVTSVLRFVNRDKERDRHNNLRSGKRKPRRKIKDRSLQYADSFIFVPGEINSDVVNSSRLRSNTCADNLSPQHDVNPGINFGKSIKSRISQEVEDRCVKYEEETRGSQVAYFADHPSSNGPYPLPSEAMAYEIHCPPGERYCHLRPTSFGAMEYTRPTDCIKPTNIWDRTNDSDLESIDEGREKSGLFIYFVKERIHVHGYIHVDWCNIFVKVTVQHVCCLFPLSWYTVMAQ